MCALKVHVIVHPKPCSLVPETLFESGAGDENRSIFWVFRAFQSDLSADFFKSTLLNHSYQG